MEAYVAPPVRVHAAVGAAADSRATAGAWPPPRGVAAAAAAPLGVARPARAARVGGQWPRRRCSLAAAHGRRGRPAAQRGVVVASVGGEVPSSTTGGSGAAAATAATSGPAGAALDAPCDTEVLLYDTTLRDGTQQEGISLSVMDKLRVVEKLDHFGVDYIEGMAAGAGACGGHFGCRRASRGGGRTPRVTAAGLTFGRVPLVGSSSAAWGVGRLGPETWWAMYRLLT